MHRSKPFLTVGNLKKHICREHTGTQSHSAFPVNFFLQQSTATNAVWYIEKWQPEETHLQRAHWHTVHYVLRVEIEACLKVNDHFAQCSAFQSKFFSPPTDELYKHCDYDLLKNNNLNNHICREHIGTRSHSAFQPDPVQVFLQQTNYTIHYNKCCVICWRIAINPKNHICRESSSSQRVFLQQINCTIQVLWSEIFSSQFFFSSFGCF